MAIAGDATAPRLPTIREADRASCGRRTTPRRTRRCKAAIAAALAALHRESHAIYKPDEIARSHATTQLPREAPGRQLRGPRPRHLPDHRRPTAKRSVKTGDLPATS